MLFFQELGLNCRSWEADQFCFFLLACELCVVRSIAFCFCYCWTPIRWQVLREWMSCFGGGTMKMWTIGRSGSQWLPRCETSMRISCTRSPSWICEVEPKNGSRSCIWCQLTRPNWGSWSCKNMGILMMMTFEWSSMPSNKNPGRGFKNILSGLINCSRRERY